MTIYFAEMGSWLKIGYTLADNASKRIAQLQTGQPQKIILLGTISGDRDAELGLHEEFASSRGNGEWFYRDEIISIVRFLIDNQHPWYECRQRPRGISWERAFKVLPPTDLSAYDAPGIPVVTSSIISRAANTRIRAHRKKYGRDLEWEANLCERMADHQPQATLRHPYLVAWQSLGQKST